ncbi:RNA polymerase sigma factor [Oryzobacter telluris]|uniref:RNA polymerase sigma factor n=1 Tax=Oryzobacter telluris TaxID=3149179 RepID=UPI00370D2B99
MSPEEFDELYRASAPRLVGQVHAMCGDVAEAQDVVQEAFERAWQHRSRLDRERSPEAWVRVTAMRLAVSRWRRQRNAVLAWRRRAHDLVDAPGEPFDPVLVAALLALPEAQRLAIVLHHLADLSVEAVAAELAVPVGTVKARLSRGRRALAAALAAPTVKEGRHV